MSERFVRADDGGKLLDASELAPDETLAGRDLRGWTLTGDFSCRDFVGTDLRLAILDGCILRNVKAQRANFKDASMRGVDASRADIRGASLAGVAAHGLSLRRANAVLARMAGMWTRGHVPPPEIKAREDGSMPDLDPLDETNEFAVRMAEEWTEPVDAAKEAEEDAEDKAVTVKKLDLRGGIFRDCSFVDANLRGANLSKANLKRSNLSGANLGHANLEQANLNMANLNHTNLEGALLRAVNMKQSNFEGTRLDYATLIDSDFEASNFEGASLAFAMCRGCLFAQSLFADTDLIGVTLAGCNARGIVTMVRGSQPAVFTGANLEDTDLENAKLSHAVFVGARLGGAKLFGALIDCADFAGATWTKEENRVELKEINDEELEKLLRPGVQLNGYNLIGKRFEHAQHDEKGKKLEPRQVCLVGSTFAGSNMYKAYFDGCDMRYAILESANASSATFAGTKLAHCELSLAVMVGAMMERADLSASNLAETDLRNARLAFSSFKSANLTNAKLGGADLRDVQFDDAIVDGVDFNNATVSRYPMPAKPRERKQQVRAAAMHRIAVQLGKATVLAMGSDDDSDAGDEDDHVAGDQTQQMVMSMAEEAINGMASGLSDLVPQVIAACKNTDKVLDAAVKEAIDVLDSKMGNATMRALDAAAANPDRVTAAAAVEDLLQQELDMLLEKVFGESGMLHKVAGNAVGKAAGDMADEAAGDEVSQLIQAGAELGVPQVLELLLRNTIRKHTELVLKKLAFGVAERIDRRFAPAVESRRRRSSSSVAVADATALLNAPSAAYCEALHELLDRVEKCLDDPSRIAQQWLLQQCGKLLGASSGGLATIDARATALQKALQSKLTEEHKKMLFDDSKESLAAQLNAHVRSTTAKRALAKASRFAEKGWLATLTLVVSTDPLVLSKHEKELSYLLEKLGKLEDADVTEQQWRDYYESWASFLALRPKLEAECAQHIFDAITTDESVFTGLGVAHLLKDSVINSGQVPTELLLQLQQGPAKHVKNYAYTYRRKLDTELTKIGRIGTLQQRAVALAGTGTVAVFVGASNVLGQLYYDVLQSNGVLAVVIAGVAIGVLLITSVTITMCIRRMRMRSI